MDVHTAFLCLISVQILHKTTRRAKENHYRKCKQPRGLCFPGTVFWFWKPLLKGASTSLSWDQWAWPTGALVTAGTLPNFFLGFQPFSAMWPQGRAGLPASRTGLYSTCWSHLIQWRTQIPFKATALFVLKPPDPRLLCPQPRFVWGTCLGYSSISDSPQGSNEIS